MFKAVPKKIFTKGLENYTQLLGVLGITSPYKWEAGIYGLKGKYLYYPPPPEKVWLDKNGPVCATDKIEASGEYDGEKSYASSLMPFFEKIFQKCNRSRPDYLPQ